MLKISKLIVAMVLIISSSYALITKNFEFMLYMQFCLGALMLLMGLEALQKGKKRFWYISITISLFIFVVGVQTLLVN